jgi:hypothetical protein
MMVDMSAGWGKAKSKTTLTLHFFIDSNGSSLCGMAAGTEKIHETPDEYWKCDYCKKKIAENS